MQCVGPDLQLPVVKNGGIAGPEDIADEDPCHDIAEPHVAVSVHEDYVKMRFSHSVSFPVELSAHFS